MKARKRSRRLALEALESRLPLAASAVVSFGNLTVSSNTAADLALVQTAADTWSVTDAGVAVGAGTFAGVTGNVTVRTSAAADKINIDLGGFTAQRNVVLAAGNGANQILVRNGTVKKELVLAAGSGLDTFDLNALTVSGGTEISTGRGDNTVNVIASTLTRGLHLLTGSGLDRVTLGDGAAAATIGGVNYIDGGGDLDALTVRSLVTISGAVRTAFVNTTTLEAGSRVTRDVDFLGGHNVANSLSASGTIDGSVYYVGSSGVDTLTTAAGSQVGGSVNALLGWGSDVVTLAGNISKSLNLDTGLGNDLVNFGGVVTQRAAVLLGLGNDTLNFTGRVGAVGATNSRLDIDASAGNDRVDIKAGSAVNGQLLVSLSLGNDVFVLDAAATVVSGHINGGLGADTYQGARPRAGVVDRLFETFV